MLKKLTNLLKTSSFFLLILFFLFLFSTNEIKAQKIYLAITPPISEAMIMPGKSIKQIFTLSNSGSDIYLTPKILYFLPSEKNDGNVKITDKKAPEWVSFDANQFLLKGGETKNLEVTISPPQDSEEIDHYLTLLFESKTASSLLTGSESLYKAEIGANLLLTITKDGNPKKSAEIKEFSAPLILDSLFPLKFSVLLTNNGNYFWKPNGKIILNGKDSLKLAPLNILSGDSRYIPCIDNEEIISCEKKDKIFLGVIKSKLEFNLDEESKIYSQETTTYVFPFTLTAVIIILSLFYLTRKKLSLIVRNIYARR